MSKRSKKTEEKCFAFTESKSKKETYSKITMDEKIDAVKEENNEQIGNVEEKLKSRDVYCFNVGDMGAKGIYDFLQVGVENGVMNENNARMMFSLNSSNKGKYKNIPTVAQNLNTFIGMREVIYKAGTSASNAHILVKLTEMYPEAGRIHFCFLNYGKWTSWKVIAPELSLKTIATIGVNATTKTNSLRRNDKIVKFNCVMGLKITLGGKESIEAGTITEACRPMGDNIYTSAITKSGMIVDVIIKTDGKIIIENPSEGIKLNPADYFTINETWIRD